MYDLLKTNKRIIKKYLYIIIQIIHYLMVVREIQNINYIHSFVPEQLTHHNNLHNGKNLY